jgi:HEAT repeat protein
MPATGRIYRLIDDALDTEKPRNREDAIKALGVSGDPRAVRPLVDCCQDPDPEIRLHAIDALNKLKSGRSVTVLVERLKDRTEQPAIREHAADALAVIRSYGAITSLRECALDPEEVPAIRSYVSLLLERSVSL